MSHHRTGVDGVAERLREAMFRKGLGPRELARISGVGYSNVRFHIVGETNPSLFALARYCRALNVSADWVLFGKELPDAEQR